MQTMKKARVSVALSSLRQIDFFEPLTWDCRRCTVIRSHPSGN